MDSLNLIGKEQAFQTVSAAALEGKLSHALVITGEKGIGKSTFADAVCKLIFCSEEKKPCNECKACRKIQKGIHPDIFKIYPAGKSETIGVNEIEIVKQNIYIKPNDSEFKVFIIYSAEKMNRFAQNALLKMVEEPPEYCYFIFTCQNLQALLPTVRSRMVSVSLSAASKSEVERFLCETVPEISQAEASNAAERSRGILGLALELVTDLETAELYKNLDDVAKAICDHDRALLCLELGKYSKKKENALRLAELLSLVFRDVCVSSAGGKNVLSGCKSAVEQLSKTCSGKAAMEAMEACKSFVSAVRGNANLALSLAAFEITLGNIIRR